MAQQTGEFRRSVCKNDNSVENVKSAHMAVFNEPQKFPDIWYLALLSFSSFFQAWEVHQGFLAFFFFFLKKSLHAAKLASHM